MGKKFRQKGRMADTSPTLFPIEDGTEVGAVAPSSTVERWDVPKSWAWARFCDVGEVRLGMARSPQNRPGAFATRYLRAANITTNGLDLSNLLEMDFEPEAREVYALRPGDIVLSEASGSPDQVGKAALWRGELALCGFQNTVLRVRVTGISPDYVLIVLDHYFKNGLFAGMVRGMGIGHLGLDRFSQLPCPLPPKPEQERIVAEFSIQAEHASKALASLRSAEEKMRLQRRSIVMQELGVSRATGGDDLPHGWAKVKVGELCEVVNGRAFKSNEWRDEGLPIIRIQNLRNKDASFNYYDGDLDEKHLVDDGDILFAWSGDSGTSFGAYIWRGEQGALNQHIFKLTPEENRVTRDFLFHSLNANLEAYAAAAKGGGKRLHLTRSQFVDSEVVVPPLKEQARIVNAINMHESTLEDQAAIVARSIWKTETLLKSLLARAVEGALVEQNTDEGNASSLLAECRTNLKRYLENLAERRRAARKEFMSKKQSGATLPKRDLVDVLKEEGPLLPRELLRRSGYREESSNDVEAFYRLLNVACRSERIVQDEGAARDQAKLKAVV